MSSSVFYKFKNSKDPERIVFDGTGISVFELKREIITASGLGDGSDFDLHLYPVDQPTTEYDDDTTIISRSSTVVAVRRPAARGHGRAARYVSGRAPVRAIKKADVAKPISAPTTGGVLSEQDAEAAFLAESAQVWDQQKESLSHAKPVYRNKKPVNVPTHDPPPGYVCYRCQKKGHWIQACPTNDDPDFKPVARAKRTTGIPRSFLKTVDKPEGDLEDARGVMLNADGEYVQVMTDTKTWEKFQEKATASKAQAANADAANKDMEERGLACPIDKRMYVDPVKTPCCGKTYCHDCIENALADGDLVCPNCATDGVLIDDLVSDEDMVGLIRAYEAEKTKEKLDKEQHAKEEEKAKAAASANPSSPSVNETKVSVSSPPTDEKATAGDNTSRSASKSPKPETSSRAPSSTSTSHVKSPLTVAAKPSSVSGGNASDTDTSTTSKKRKEAPTEIKAPTAPKAMRMQKEQQSRQAEDQSAILQKTFMEEMEALKNNMLPLPTMSTMGMPVNPMMGMVNPPNMNGMNGMNPMASMNNMNGFGAAANGQWNPAFNNGAAGYSNQAPFSNMGYANNMNGYGNMPFMNGMQQGHTMSGYGQGFNNQGYGPGSGSGGNANSNNNNNMYANQGGQQNGNFPNQQRTVFAEQPNLQDAYERRPLNPHRSQGRRKARAPDFHYVG